MIAIAPAIFPSPVIFRFRIAEDFQPVAEKTEGHIKKLCDVAPIYRYPRNSYQRKASSVFLFFFLQHPRSFATDFSDKKRRLEHPSVDAQVAFDDCSFRYQSALKSK